MVEADHVVADHVVGVHVADSSVLNVYLKIIGHIMEGVFNILSLRRYRSRVF